MVLKKQASACSCGNFMKVFIAVDNIDAASATATSSPVAIAAEKYHTQEYKTSNWLDANAVCYLWSVKHVTKIIFSIEHWKSYSHNCIHNTWKHEIVPWAVKSVARYFEYRRSKIF